MQQHFLNPKLEKFSKNFERFVIEAIAEKSIDKETAEDIRYIIEEYMNSGMIGEDLDVYNDDLIDGNDFACLNEEEFSN